MKEEKMTPLRERMIKDLHRAGQLTFFSDLDRLTQQDTFAQWLAPFRKTEWVVYAKRPFGGPEAVLAYLSRYTHRVAISNQRLVIADANTVAGLGFYEHGETPGLGGEVDNPRWKALWSGKEVYREGEAALGSIKGSVDSGSANASYQVDGLSGATLTSRGVTNLVQFWLGEQGFASFLHNLTAGEA